MAWRLFGKSAPSNKSSAGATERSANIENASVQALRKQAKHRLIGSAVLLTLAIAFFAWLLDGQPRPLGAGKAADWSIELQGESSKAPSNPAPTQALASTEAEPKTNAEPAKTEAEPSPPTQTVNAAAPPKPAEAAVATVNPSVAVTPTPQKAPSAVSAQASPEPTEKMTKPEPKKDSAKPPEKASESDKNQDKSKRYVVQVGAFAEVVKAREARLKVEKLGLKTYTQVITNAEGRRIRVRVGPFETEADAEKAAKRIKAADLSAAVLKL
jgi:DedD protein